MATAENEKYPKVRVTKQAREHLEKLIPAERARRGLNVSMTDVVSELILNQPIPVIPTISKRRTRIATKTPVAMSAA